MKLKTRKVALISGKEKGPLLAEKIGRNDPCPCRSGKKAKDCCGATTKYYQRVKQS